MSIIKILTALMGIPENVHSPIHFSSFLSLQSFSFFLTLLSTHMSHPSLKDSGKCWVKSKTSRETWLDSIARSTDSAAPWQNCHKPLGEVQLFVSSAQLVITDKFFLIQPLPFLCLTSFSGFSHLLILLSLIPSISLFLCFPL